MVTLLTEAKFIFEQNLPKRDFTGTEYPPRETTHDVVRHETSKVLVKGRKQEEGASRHTHFIKSVLLVSLTLRCRHSRSNQLFLLSVTSSKLAEAKEGRG